MNLREEMLKYAVFDAAVLTQSYDTIVLIFNQKSSFHALRFTVTLA